MIPTSDTTPQVPSPIPICVMPKADEISDEGFGYFRGTWFIGRAALADAQSIVRQEAVVMEWLDEVAANPEEFEQLASAIEAGDMELLPDSIRGSAIAKGICTFVTEFEETAPLDGLEIGVAGLTYVLSATGCLTAASCRWHVRSDSWADCPVVFFAAPNWRVHLLAEFIASEGCGLGQDRNMLTIYGSSIRDTHRLAQRILVERGRFRSRPESSRSLSRAPARSSPAQLDLLPDWKQ